MESSWSRPRLAELATTAVAKVQEGRTRSAGTMVEYETASSNLAGIVISHIRDTTSRSDGLISLGLMVKCEVALSSLVSILTSHNLHINLRLGLRKLKNQATQSRRTTVTDTHGSRAIVLGTHEREPSKSLQHSCPTAA